MAFQKLCFFAFLLLQLALTACETTQTTQASYELEKVEVVVEGMVYCQSCDHAGSWSLTGAEPTPSTKVNVVCKDYKGRVSFYKDFITNEEGRAQNFQDETLLLGPPTPVMHCAPGLLSQAWVQPPHQSQLRHRWFSSSVWEEEIVRRELPGGGVFRWAAGFPSIPLPCKDSPVMKAGHVIVVVLKHCFSVK